MQFIDLKAQQNQIKEKVLKRIQNILDHGKYIMGPEVFELEKKLTEYVGIKHCVTCSSGTDALLIPLMAKGISAGDAIITSPFTYIATAEVISLLGATPVFCDVYTETYNINPDNLKEAYDFALSKNLVPRGIISVDLFGLPARYRLINEFAKKYDLFILEDAAQSFGGQIRKHKSGSFGHVAATSFFPAKPLGCYGDGGAIFTNDDELAQKMRSIRVHGSGKNKYENVRIGINGRLDTLQAAILLEKLTIFPNEVKSRNRVADYYNANINNGLKTPHIPEGYISSWAQYSVLARSNKERNDKIEHLKTNNIPFMIYYRMPLHLQKAFRDLGYHKGDFPVTEEKADNIFSIPMHPYLRKVQQNKILEVLHYSA